MSVVEQPVAPAPAQEEAVEAPTPVRLADGVSLSELIQRARNASGEEQAWLCTLVNRALCALGAAKDKDRQAALLLEMLDDEALHGLVDERQVPCRAVAVEALLTIGYPWALQLDPDDVLFLRANPSQSRTPLPLAQVFGGLAGVGAAAGLGMSLLSLPNWWRLVAFESPSETVLAVAMVVTAAASFPVVLGAPLLKPGRWLMGLAGLAASTVVMLDAASQGPSLGHLFLLAIPAFGLLGAGLPRQRKTG